VVAATQILDRLAPASGEHQQQHDPVPHLDFPPTTLAGGLDPSAVCGALWGFAES
jgi:hypothetical protein